MTTQEYETIVEKSPGLVHSLLEFHLKNAVAEIKRLREKYETQRIERHDNPKG